MSPDDLGRKAFEAFKQDLAPSCWDKQTWDSTHPHQKKAWCKAAQACYDAGEADGYSDGYDGGCRAEYDV